VEVGDGVNEEGNASEREAASENIKGKTLSTKTSF